MTTKREAAEVLIVRTDDGGSYAVPRSVVENALIGEEHRAELAALIEQGDVSGFSAGVLLPYFGDDGDGYYALPREVIQRYRVPAERTGEVDAALGDANDVQGHGWCPPGYRSVSIFMGYSTWGGYPIYAHTCVPDPRVQGRIAPTSPFVKL